MRIIAHLDMDAFFAAIEERDNPRFFNRPIVVGSDPRAGKGRGVVSTANYKARVYGVRSAMPISIAWEKAKYAKEMGDEFVFVGVDMERYEYESKKIRSIISTHFDKIEQASIDEFYIDCSNLKSFKCAKDNFFALQKEIFESEKITCSIGVGPNKLIAKIASDFKKPNGLTIVTEEEIESFLSPLSISRVPGIGPKAQESFSKIGVSTIGDVINFSFEVLEKRFGKVGIDVYRKVRGFDDAPVSEERDAKSIGSQETFMKDTKNVLEITELIHKLTEDVFRRFEASEFSSFSRIAIVVRYSNFVTKNKSKTFELPIKTKKDFEFAVLQLFFPFIEKIGNKKENALRLLGVRIEKLQRQINLL